MRAVMRLSLVITIVVTQIFVRGKIVTALSDNYFLPVQQEMPDLSEVFFYEEGRYLPAFGTVFENCQNIQRRKITAEHETSINATPNDRFFSNLGYHGNIDNGVALSSLTPDDIVRRFWIGVDMRPGQGCSERNVAPITGKTIQDVDMKKKLMN